MRQELESLIGADRSQIVLELLAEHDQYDLAGKNDSPLKDFVADLMAALLAQVEDLSPDSIEAAQRLSDWFRPGKHDFAPRPENSH